MAFNYLFTLAVVEKKEHYYLYYRSMLVNEFVSRQSHDPTVIGVPLIAT